MDAKQLEQRFLEAYELYSDAIFRYCFFRVYQKQDAEELTQEAFIKTWNYLSEGKPIDNLRAFLYQVTRNLIIDRKRKERPSVSIEELFEVGIELEGPHQKNIQTILEQKELLEQLDRLEDEQKELLLLRFIQGYTPKEIANLLQETPNVISVRITRAKQALHQLYVSPQQTT